MCQKCVEPNENPKLEVQVILGGGIRKLKRIKQSTKRVGVRPRSKGDVEE